jgi:hypothetical protein
MQRAPPSRPQARDSPNATGNHRRRD